MIVFATALLCNVLALAIFIAGGVGYVDSYWAVIAGYLLLLLAMALYWGGRGRLR